MRIPIYIIDAFTDTLFKGNPAAVCVLNEWLPENIMQSIAFENNLSETAFLFKQNDIYQLRWFTPSYEVPICGHGTLASAFVVLNELEKNDKVIFNTKSGLLTVTKRDQYLCMDFPREKITPVDHPPQALLDSVSIKPKAVYKYTRYLLIYDKQSDIENIKINCASAQQLDNPKINITAPGHEVDFVSRYFIPLENRFEDPVTGSAHCALAPYWAERLNKSTLHARQLSPRGGDIICELDGDRVKLFGKAMLYSRGNLFL